MSFIVRLLPSWKVMPLRVLKTHFFAPSDESEALGKVADYAAIRRDLGQVIAERTIEGGLGEARRPCAGSSVSCCEASDMPNRA